MKSAKRARLQQAGWKIGSAQEFLGLTEEEMALIEMRLALGPLAFTPWFGRGAVVKRASPSPWRVVSEPCEPPRRPRIARD